MHGFLIYHLPTTVTLLQLKLSCDGSLLMVCPIVVKQHPTVLANMAVLETALAPHDMQTGDVIHQAVRTHRRQTDLLSQTS